MKKQTFRLNNAGDQDATVDAILALADMGFDVSCVMLESVSIIQATREFADDESEEELQTRH